MTWGIKDKMSRGIDYFLRVGLSIAGFTIAGFMIFSLGLVERSFVGLSFLLGLVVSVGTCVYDEFKYRKEERKE